MEAKGFKEFAFKDNAIALAIGIIIGTAFKDLIDAIVKNIFTPPIGFLTADVDFSELFITLGRESYETVAEAEAAGAVIIRYGDVLNAFIIFLITGIVLYIFIFKTNERISKALAKEKKEKKRTTKKCIYCISEINIEATRCPNCTSKLPIIQEK
jgi:large conductance mechanosensitive channel